MQSIVVTIPRKGIASGKSAPSFTSEGFQGETCRDATSVLAKMMGNVVSDVPTGEVVNADLNVERLHEEG